MPADGPTRVLTARPRRPGASRRASTEGWERGGSLGIAFRRTLVLGFVLLVRLPTTPPPLPVYRAGSGPCWRGPPRPAVGRDRATGPRGSLSASAPPCARPSVRGIAVAAGVVVVGAAVVDVIAAVRDRGRDRVLGLVAGVTGAALGVAVLAWPTVTTLVIAVVVALRLLVSGVVRLASLLRRTPSPPIVPRRRAASVSGPRGSAWSSPSPPRACRSPCTDPPGEPGPFYDAPDDLPVRPARSSGPR